MVGFALAAVVIVLDQLSKWAVLRAFGEGPFTEACRRFRDRQACGGIELTPFVDLSMVWNRGVSFGMLQAESGIGRWALVVFSAAVASLLAVWLRRVNRPFAALALGLVIGGAIGNMIDRARFGAVVDFIDFSGPWFGVVIGSWKLGFPWVFNIADAAINVGAAFLVLEILLDRRPSPAQS
jgi:signal peptidase II